MRQPSSEIITKLSICQLYTNGMEKFLACPEKFLYFAKITGYFLFEKITGKCLGMSEKIFLATSPPPPPMIKRI